MEKVNEEVSGSDFIMEYKRKLDAAYYPVATGTTIQAGFYFKIKDENGSMTENDAFSNPNTYVDIPVEYTSGGGGGGDGTGSNASTLVAASALLLSALAF